MHQMSNENHASGQTPRVKGCSTSSALDAIRALGPSASKCAFELWNGEMPEGVGAALQSRYCIALIATEDIGRTPSDNTHIHCHREGNDPAGRITISLGETAIAIDLDSLEKNLLLLDQLPILFVHAGGWTVARFRNDTHKLLSAMLGKPFDKKALRETEAAPQVQLDIKLGARLQIVSA